MRRLVLILAIAGLAACAPAALAQDGNPFNPLPPAPPAPTATPEPAKSASDDDVGRKTLYVIAGALVASFVAIGWWISRDARRALPPDHRPSERLREQGPHRHELKAKEKARDKGRAQRAARKRTRRAKR
jgi:hypothetical protein